MFSREGPTLRELAVQALSPSSAATTCSRQVRPHAVPHPGPVLNAAARAARLRPVRQRPRPVLRHRRRDRVLRPLCREACHRGRLQRRACWPKRARPRMRRGARRSLGARRRPRAALRRRLRPGVSFGAFGHFLPARAAPPFAQVHARAAARRALRLPVLAPPPVASPRLLGAARLRRGDAGAQRAVAAAVRHVLPGLPARRGAARPGGAGFSVDLAPCPSSAAGRRQPAGAAGRGPADARRRRRRRR